MYRRKASTFLNILKNFENLIKRKFVPFFFIVELPELIIAVVASAIIIIELILTAKFIGLICIVYVAIHMAICVWVLGKQEEAEKKMTKSANHIDIQTKEKLLAYLKQMTDRIVIVISHDNDVISCADEVIAF